MGLGDFISGIFGSTNKDKAKGYNVDQNAYEYGGHPGGAQDAANQYGGYGNDARAQANTYNQQQGAMFQTGAQSLGQAQQARGAQMDAMGLARMRANGQNLISNQVAQQQATQLAQQQASAAASARGPAALALAQQNAAANTSTGQSQIANQAMIAGAQEQLANQQAYAQQASGIRAGDVGTAGTAFGAGAQSGQLGIGQGQLGLGYAGLQNNVNQTQLAAQMNQQAQKSSNALGAQGINAQVGGQNAAINQQNALGAIGTFTSPFGAGAGGGGAPPKAHGGPVAGGHPYLVGERGPELIVPKHDGVVIPAPQTQSILASARAGGGPIEAGGAPSADTVVPVTWGNAAPANLARQSPAAPRTVPVTWGSQVAPANDPRAVDEAQQRQEIQASLDWKSPAAEQIRRRDESRLAAYNKMRGIGLELSPDEARDEQRARYSLGAGARQDAAVQKQAAAEAQAAPKKPSIADLLTGAGSQMQGMARGVDIGYHGGGGYAAPTLLTLPSYAPGRAVGGPIDAGSPYVVGEQGPEAVLPSGGLARMAPSMANAGVGQALTGEGDSGYAMKGGGLDVQGTFKKVNAGIGGAMHPNMMVSDERAKQEAFEAGASYGHHMSNFDLSGGKTQKPVAPEYMTDTLKAHMGAIPIRPMPMGGTQAPSAAAEDTRSVPWDEKTVVPLAPGQMVATRSVPWSSTPPTAAVEPRAAIAQGPLARAKSREVTREDLPLPNISAYVGARAGGGPVAAGKPYVVGEQGEEEIVPLNAVHGLEDAGVQTQYDQDAPRGQRVGLIVDAHERKSKLPRDYVPPPEAAGTERGSMPATAPLARAAGTATAPRQLTPDELRAIGEQELAKTRAQTAAIPQTSPAVAGALERPSMAYEDIYSDERAKTGLARHAPMAAANRAQEGFIYAYKPEFTPEEQAQGEKNVGPMAQNMARNPIAGTAVKEDDTGLLMLDIPKLTKLHSAGIASLQEQLDELKGGLARMRKPR